MENILINKLNEKDVEHCTTNFGLKFRRKGNKSFKKLCNVFTNANIINFCNNKNLTDEEYFSKLNTEYIPLEKYDLKKRKNNIIVERYPKLNNDEPYIFVCNHTCPEDIETVLNILDRNAYLILGSIESLKYNPEMYLSFLNGMIPFDILDKAQRKLVFEKMKRVIQTNSILIFPEGSHNYSPNKLINNLYDGPVNLALQTKRKIVIISMIRDEENEVSYVDVSNPIDIQEIYYNMKNNFNSEENIEKAKVKQLTSFIRDKMATSVYYMIERHFQTVIRKEHNDIEEKIRQNKIRDAFIKLKWERDVFDAEYLTKKSNEEIEYEQVVKSISNLVVNPNISFPFDKNWILKELDLCKKDIPNRMRLFLEESKIQKVKKRK